MEAVRSSEISLTIRQITRRNIQEESGLNLHSHRRQNLLVFYPEDGVKTYVWNVAKYLPD
jgi:ribosomal protein S15P/S13E